MPKIAFFNKVAVRCGNVTLAMDALNIWKQEWNPNHCDLLHVAAQYGEIGLCRILVEKYNFGVNSFDTTGTDVIRLWQLKPRFTCFHLKMLY